MEQIVLVHLSDVHIEANILNRRFGWIGGYRPHDLLLCRALGIALEDVRYVAELSGDEHFTMVLSGDLTCEGLPGDFAAAQFFFRGERPLDFNRPLGMVGLKLPHYRILMVPGNHDHWKGQRFPARPYNDDIFGAEFKSTPWKFTLFSPQKRLVLELIGVDSNSGMKGITRVFDSIRARGRISAGEFSEIDRLVRQPPPAGLPEKAERVRAIVVHHPFSVPYGVGGAQPLDPKSRAKLLQFSSRHHVAAILNGHTHQFHFEGHTSSPGSSRASTWEFRCATSLQGPAASGSQGFLVHQLRIDDQNSISWRVWRYDWNGSRFVRPDDEPWFVIPVRAQLPATA